MTVPTEQLERARAIVLHVAELVDLCQLDFATKQLAAFIAEAVQQARLEEAKWWAGKWNQEYGLCSPEMNCSECTGLHQHIAELERPAERKEEQ